MKISKDDGTELELSVSNKTLFRIIGFIIVAVIGYFTLRQIAGTLVLISTAFFLALALNSPVRWLSRKLPGSKKGNRKLATILSIIVIVVALIGFLSAIIPPLVKQTTTFISTVPQLVSDARDQDTALGSFVRKYNLGDQVDKLSKSLSDRIGDIGSSAITTVTSIGSGLFAFITVIALTVMMILEGSNWTKLAYDLIPPNRRSHIKRLAGEMLQVVQGYVNGQVILAATAAVLIVPIFFIMGVKYPIALMVVVFICGLIPMVGHTIGAIFCTIVALFTSIPSALVVLGYYILYQQIENYAVQPKIQAKSTNMTPLLVFISVLIGANFGGILGALVAIPVMGCLRILVLDYLEQRDILSPAEVDAVNGEITNGSIARKTKKIK